MSKSTSVAFCGTADLCELSDTELDAVSAAGYAHAVYQSSFGQFSMGNIAIGVQVNNQVNVTVLSFGSVQGGAQTNINNAGNIGF